MEITARAIESDAPRARQLRIALVSMPFTATRRPSMQIGLLKALAVANGFAARGFHFYLDFERLVGHKLCDYLAESTAQLEGEWLFSLEAFGSACPREADVYQEVFATDLAPLYSRTGLTPSDLREVRLKVVPAYLDYLLRKVHWDEFDVVGFTSMFEQNVASIALARRIKQRFPHVLTLFGGANFDGEMGAEYVRAIDAIDYAIVGEADESFPRFLHALARKADPRLVPGVVSRSPTASAVPPKPSLWNLADSPAPDFSDYFEQATALGLSDENSVADISIPFESSRGCWWGQKQHCTFCGLNGQTMQFRSKPPDRVLNELEEQARKYRSFRFLAVDNILSMNYFTEVFDKIAAQRSDFQLFYEVKSNLTRDKIRRMHQGGVRIVQPGIESLDSRVLSLMRKGVSAIQNVNTLRWLNHYGIGATWNMLWGFPGETVADYETQARLIPHLWHLQPPRAFGRIAMQRFSPIFNDARSFPCRVKRPAPCYRYIYPSHLDLERVAFYFEYQFADSLPDAAYEPVSRVLTEWQQRWERQPWPSLTFRAAPGFTQIWDLRSTELRTWNLEGTEARLYVACSDAPRTAAQLAAELQLQDQVDRVTETLRSFVARGISMSDGPQFLSLALPWSRNR